MIVNTSKSVDLAKAIVFENMKKLDLYPSSDLSFKGGLIFGRPAVLLSSGKVNVCSSKSEVQISFDIKISRISYLFLLIWFAFSNVIFYLIGRDILMFAAFNNILILVTIFYWQDRIASIKASIVKGLQD